MSIGERKNFRNNFSVARSEIIAVESHERHHGQEPDALVAVPIRVVPDQAKCVSCGQGRHIRSIDVMPLLLRSCQSSLESVLVADSRQPAMFAQLIMVDGVNDNAAEPVGLATSPGHRLFGEFSKRVTVLFGGLRSNLQRAFGFWIVRCEENSPVRFHGENAIPRFQAKTVGHILGQRGADGTTGLAEGDFLGHSRSVAH
jgi:hypothetical protein